MYASGYADTSLVITRIKPCADLSIHRLVAVDDSSQRRLLDASEPAVYAAVEPHQLYVDVHIAYLSVLP